MKNQSKIINKKEIYVVTKGSYSDYGVCGIFDDKELAQKYIDSFSKDGFSEMIIEIYPINPNEKYIRKGFIPYFLRMTKEGETTEIERSDNDYGFRIEEDLGFDFNKNMFLHVFAKDEKHAIKIANEKRTQLIALNKWGK